MNHKDFKGDVVNFGVRLTRLKTAVGPKQSYKGHQIAAEQDLNTGEFYPWVDGDSELGISCDTESQALKEAKEHVDWMDRK